MTDAEILKEIERRLQEWFSEPDGWHEDSSGLHLVKQTIEGLRENGAFSEWPLC